MADEVESVIALLKSLAGSDQAKERKHDVIFKKAWMFLEDRCRWLEMRHAPTDGTPVLLLLDVPIDTNDLCGFVRVDALQIVVGWASSEVSTDRVPFWQCGFCEEGTADTEGGAPILQIRLRPKAWMPLPKVEA